MKKWDQFLNEIGTGELYNWAKATDTDEIDHLLIIADALEEAGYPNVHTFRDAVERLRLAHIQGMDNTGSYAGVYWEIRRRVIRLQTEAEHWLQRRMHGVDWSGPWQK